MTFKAISNGIGKATTSVMKSDIIQNIVRDLKSLRALWNWIIGIFFVWCCWYSMTHYPASANTIVITVGGVFSAMMTNYVWSHHMEKKNGNGTTPQKSIEQVKPAVKVSDEEASGDA